MATTSPTQPLTLPNILPSELANLLGTQPSIYTTAFSNMLINLPRDLVAPVGIFLAQILEYLPHTLHPVITARQPGLTQNFYELMIPFTVKLIILHGTAIIIAVCRLPSPNLISAFSDVLDGLNFVMYTSMGNSIPDLINWLLFVVSPIPVTSPSPELDDLLIHLVNVLFSDLSALLPALMSVTATDDTGPYMAEVIYPLVDFFTGLITDERLRPLQNHLHNSAAAGNHDLEEFSLAYTYEAKGDAETDQDICMVCLEEMKDGDNARRLCCLHAFHMDCIDRWLEMNEICPICRTHITATHEIESTLDGARS